MGRAICFRCRRPVIQAACKCNRVLPTHERRNNVHRIKGGWTRRKFGDMIYYYLYKLYPGTSIYETKWLGVDLTFSRDDVAGMLRTVRQQLRDTMK